MPASLLPTRLVRPAVTRIVGPAGLAIAVALMASPDRAPLRRPKPLPAWSFHAAVTITPTTSVDIVAAPEVTSPASSVARFSVLPLSAVAAIVDVRRLREVAVARIGSLHGP